MKPNHTKITPTQQHTKQNLKPKTNRNANKKAKTPKHPQPHKRKPKT
jgi:hypothetical protein